MGRKKVNYSLEELRTMFKHIYLKDNTMYATKSNLPLNDDDEVFVFENLQEKYVNKTNEWFNAEELRMIGEQECLFSQW